MGTLFIQLPDELGAETDFKIVYDQEGRPSEVLLPYDTFQKLIDLVQNRQIISQAETPQTEWQNQLLAISTWSEAQIEALKEGRDLINQWRPQPFS